MNFHISFFYSRIIRFKLSRIIRFLCGIIITSIYQTYYIVLILKTICKGLQIQKQTELRCKTFTAVYFFSLGFPLLILVTHMKAGVGRGYYHSSYLSFCLLTNIQAFVCSFVCRHLSDYLFLLITAHIIAKFLFDEFYQSLEINNPFHLLILWQILLQ